MAPAAPDDVNPVQTSEPESDAQFLETPFVNLWTLLLVYARKIVNDGHPEDLVQEAALRAVQNHRTLRGLSEFELLKWLRKTMKHLAIDQYRRLQRIPSNDQIASILLKSHKSAPQILTDEEREEFVRTFWLMVDDLSPKDSTFMRMRLKEGYKIREIAANFQCDPSLISRRFKELFKKIRKALWNKFQFHDS